MKTENVALAELPNWVRKVFKEVSPSLKKAARAAALQGKIEVLKNIKRTLPHPPVDRGAYRASWQVATVPDGAVLFSDAPHAAFIEYGTRPHMPPLLPILRWVVRKQLAGKVASSRARQKAFAAGEESPGRGKQVDVMMDELSIARAIQRSIAKKGTKPRKVLERSMPMILFYFQKEIDRALQEALG